MSDKETRRRFRPRAQSKPQVVPAEPERGDKAAEELAVIDWSSLVEQPEPLSFWADDAQRPPAQLALPAERAQVEDVDERRHACDLIGSKLREHIAAAEHAGSGMTINTTMERTAAELFDGSTRYLSTQTTTIAEMSVMLAPRLHDLRDMALGAAAAMFYHVLGRIVDCVFQGQEVAAVIGCALVPVNHPTLDGFYLAVRAVDFRSRNMLLVVADSGDVVQVLEIGPTESIVQAFSRWRRLL